MPTAGTKKKAAVKPAKAQEVVVRGYKGFDADFRCLGYQYEVGKTYEHTGPVRMCSSGFHCIDGNPLDVLDYYPLIGNDGRLNRFASVTAYGEIGRDKTSKIVTAKLSVSAELRLPDLIASAIKFVAASCKGKETAASGDYSQLAASGDYSQLAASGNASKLAASGYYSKLAASGDYSQLAASGDASKLAASGYYSQLAASGNASQLAASGNASKLAASGDASKLAASGYSSKLAASGNASQLAASGNASKLAASGYSSKLEITGAASVAAAVGPNSAIKAAAGTPVAVCEYDRNGKPLGFATGVTGQNGVPADTWLVAKDGKLVEAK